MEITLTDFRKIVRSIIQEEMKMNGNGAFDKSRIDGGNKKGSVKTKGAGDHKKYGTKDATGNSAKNANVLKGTKAKGGKEVTNMNGNGAFDKRIANGEKSKEMDKKGSSDGNKKIKVTFGSKAKKL